VNGDAPRRPIRHRHSQYPLGALYDYWNPYWNAYDGYGSYNYNQATYPGQFGENNADVEQPAEATVDAVIPPRQAEDDAASPVLRSALLASPQWREADEQVKIAQAQYDTAAAKVLEKLKAQPSYQQAVARKDQDAQRVAWLKAKDPDPSISRAAPVATAKLDAAKVVTDMQNAALATDPQASVAKVKLDTALARRDEARQAVEAQIRKSAPVAPSAGGR
jgi:hypothetical protein